ncbi:MAG: peptidyl-prolyl cis-trans isomerase [Candidatus Omnitrophica bacterium]|nr:peptidyl-prolyl cis-trans isomerase [Candidatus Omnitrophota bacterium]
MKNILLTIIIVIIFSQMVCGGENESSQNRIVAIINDELITKSELEHKKTFLIYQIKQNRKGDITQEEEKELEKTLLDRLIINKLVREKAKKENISATEGEIKEMLDNVKKKFPTEEVFLSGLKESGLSIDDLRESFEYEIILQKLFFNKVRNKIVVTPQEVEEFYKEHSEEFREPDRVKLKNIFVYKQGRSSEEIMQRLDEISILLEENTPFEEVARKYSEGTTAFKGGIMGEIKRGELSPRIEEIIFSLRTGDISQWIETEGGFYLFKVDEYIRGKTLNFADVQLDIRNMLYRRKLDERFNNWVAELKEKAFIQINE